MFNTLLKEYSENEKKYILQLEVQTLVLIPIHNYRDQYIFPELLPLVNSKIKAPLTDDVDFVFTEYVLLETSVHISQKVITETLLYKGFSRIIIGTKYILDIFISDNRAVSFSFVQAKSLRSIHKILENLIPLFGSTLL
eukprot:snap_masked-scaffold_24-processed-gene-3.1-mRNA-1 protein AED:1.00 eAED:1.00 QI:0/0/0/0/1/1/2/0/138